MHGKIFSLALALPLLLGGVRPADHGLVQGITISCQTWGWEWGSDGFGDELEGLAGLGANWVAIHPYARIHADGRVTWRAIDPESPPVWLARPVAESHARGMAILIKPHLAYWGSPFAWRGEIEFEDPAAKERFFSDYSAWILDVVRATREADAFAVGTELDRLVDDEVAWRRLIADVRSETPALLTYAANWTDFERVPFWDALDAVGVQAYFPLSDVDDPDEAELRAGWRKVLEPLRALHEKSGKPVVFTELGYHRSLAAARRPWSDEGASRSEVERATVLQERCLRIALEVLQAEASWLRGAFLWKWFVGEPHPNDRTFVLNTPELRGVIAQVWGHRRR